MADHAEESAHTGSAEALSEPELEQLVDRVYRLLRDELRLARVRGEPPLGRARPTGRRLC